MNITSFRDTYAFLNPMFKCHIRINGINYTNAESAFQSFRTTDKAQRERFAAFDGYNAKAIAKKLETRQDWDTIQLQVYEAVMRSKFKQNKNLAELLMQTDGNELLYCNYWKDDFFGICSPSGQNHLGKILMKIRTDLISERDSSVISETPAPKKRGRPKKA